jgi:NADH dehydrogenase
MQMGDHVAKMIAADLAGKPRPAFRYFDKGDMATIGRMDAVAKVEWPFKAHMSGFPAWVTWLTVHIFFLIGFRNRLSVFAAWVWTYFTFTRGARLITGDQRLPGWQDQLDRRLSGRCGHRSHAHSAHNPAGRDFNPSHRHPALHGRGGSEF